MLSLNLIFLLFVCLVPFATGVLIQYGDLAVAVDVYAANVLAVGLAAVVLLVYLHRHRWLLDSTAPAATRRDYLRAAVSPALFALSIPIAWANVNLAYACWLLLVPAARLTRSRDEAVVSAESGARL
ncbi:MAG: hypothetical protein M3024_08065 [Candidatus Dormibacteraeota bacterium]|nr:hypothetical protein [Candidatus Dormibacteraeota bacterium]